MATLQKIVHPMNTLRKSTLITMVILCAKLAWPQLAIADDIVVDSKPAKVTVFQNQAQIFSQVKANLVAGNNTIYIENIASSIDPNTIQIAGQGDIVILSTKYGQNFIAAPQNSGRLRILKDSLSLTQDALRSNQLNLDIYERERELLKANYAINTSSTGTSPDKIKAHADFFRLRMADINSNILKLEKAITQNKEQNDKIQRQIVALYEKRPSVGQIMVQVLAKSRTAAQLELSYVAYNAGWNPVYDIRAHDTKSPITLGYKANVWQQTGIDWPQVQLQLSTTNPSLGGNKPEIGTQWVDFYQPAPPVMYRSKSKEAKNLEEVVVMDAAAPAPAAMEAQTAADYTTVQDNGLAVSFDIAMPYTINHGGSPQLVDIQQHDLSGRFQYYAAPKLDTDAFLLANITGWEQYNLLPGQAKIFFEGAYIGESYISGNNTTDSLSIGMGRDKRINIKREKVKDMTSKKTIGANIRESYGYKITIRNTKKEAVNIQVDDQLPVSQNADIEVLDTSYAGGSLNTETGKITWDISLKPGETKVLELKYSIKYPKNKTITGQY
jgi:uncharacterized protein (TIGR02231 family)